jgi:DNA-binding response OmpR family regulator
MTVDSQRSASTVHADREESRVSRLDGLGVLEELRAQMRTASLPVIVLTAQHGESEEKALDLGAQDYLTKPVQTRSLVARVRAVLKRVNS